MKKPKKPQSFPEFLDESMRYIFDGFITEGAKGMKNRLHGCLMGAMRWSEEMKEWEKYEKSSKKNT